MNSHKVLVVDLDGTLYKANTFHYFIKYLLIFGLSHLKLLFLIKLSLALFSRVTSSHAKMKYNILNVVKDRPDINYRGFVDSMKSKRHHIPIIKDESFSFKILATAAPSCYADIIAQDEAFDLCLGTEFSNDPFSGRFENVKNIKKQNVLNYLKANNLGTVNTFVTDHIDDLPLAKVAKFNLIVNPSQTFLEELKHNSISFDVID
ncbi:HAD family hydrolase [Cognatitamlana onchidii]|uniref:HAD family hydrolase n=1 Tax=Cognatitamlana onchidii TaxID=2562860 RepID=UPI001456053A|nr:HAD family hydrolase [Algibacter onchidii]